MSKKLIFPKRVKTLLAVVLTCLITITLTGCDASNRKSTGDLNLDATYASNANSSVSVGELYDELRYYASDYVIDQTFNFVYAEEINTVKENLTKYQEKFEELILTDIYGTSDAEEIEEISAKDVKTKVQTYIDTVYQEGYTITAEQIANKEFTSLYDRYYLEVAKYVAAWNKLSEEFEGVVDGKVNFGEITDESYFTINDVVSYYDSNYTNQGYVDAVLIRFINSTEASNALKKFGIKTENGKWYQIKLDETAKESKVKYDEYYADYDVDKHILEGVTPIETQTGKGKATILKIFAAMYNYVYPYRTQIEIPGVGTPNDADGHLKYYNYVSKIIDTDYANEATAEVVMKEMYDQLLAYDNEGKEYVHMSKDRLDGYSSSLATYLYDTLQTEAKDDETTYTQFTTSAKAYGSYYYMLFKLGQEEDQELYEEVENEDGETEYKFIEGSEELQQQILNDLFEEKLNETYIHEIEDERLEDVKIKIYDSVVESQFMYVSNSELVANYDKTRKSNNNYIATVTYKDKKNTKDITVEEVYAYLEPLYGAQTAASLLFDKYIVGTSYYTDLAVDYDKYVETIEMMLYYFANDYYSSSGYPSTIGKYNFMKLYFRTSVVEDAVKNVLMLSDAKNAFIADFAEHGFAGDTFYTELLEFATNDLAKYYSLSATSLKVTLDIDEDGEADELTDAQANDAKELLEFAYEEISNSQEALANALNTVVTEFNASSRNTDEANNPTTNESKWAKYRNKGFILETVSIGEVNKTTTTTDDAVSERVKELYNDNALKLVELELGFTSNYLDNKVLDTENSKSLLLITAGALPTSAKYENVENTDLYKEISVVINDIKQNITLDYSSNDITLEQVKVYVAEYLMFGDVYSLPSTTVTALDAYILPLISKYTSSASQMLIIDNVIGAMTFAENNADRNAFYTEYKNIRIRTANSYVEETYTGWWENMYKGGNN